MFLQFLDLYGNPVYVRPERVDALRGVAVTWEGKPRAATLIVMTNRETFRVRGLVDTIHDAITAWHDERADKQFIKELRDGPPASVLAAHGFDAHGFDVR